jgi:hypothetical protein
MARRLFDAGVYVRLAVQRLRLPPELRGLLRLPDQFLQQRRSSQGIREIERPRLRVAAVEVETLVVTSFGAAMISGAAINVGEVANGVGEFQRGAGCAQGGNGLFVSGGSGAEVIRRVHGSAFLERS